MFKRLVLLLLFSISHCYSMDFLGTLAGRVTESLAQAPDEFKQRQSFTFKVSNKTNEDRYIKWYEYKPVGSMERKDTLEVGKKVQEFVQPSTGVSLVHKNSSYEIQLPEITNESIQFALATSKNESLLRQKHKLSLSLQNFLDEINRLEIDFRISDFFQKIYVQEAYEFFICSNDDDIKVTLGVEAYFRNSTLNDVSLALYLKDSNGDAIRQFDPITIKKNEVLTYFVPVSSSLDFAKDYTFYFANNENELVKKINKENIFKFQQSSRLNYFETILRSHTFTIIKSGEKITFNKPEISSWGPVSQLFSKLGGELEATHQLVSKGMFTFDTQGLQTDIRLGDDICSEEKEFLQKRDIICRRALESFLGRKLNENEQTPRIAFVFTGGGYRAMVGTVGYLLGAQEIGLLDCAQYMTGLSGSTWAIVPLVASGKSVDKFLKDESLGGESRGLAARIDKWKGFLFKDTAEVAQYLKMLYLKYVYNQEHGLVGHYGSMVANAVLDGLVSSKHTYRLSDLRKNIEEGQYPLPICVALDVRGEWQKGILDEPITKVQNLGTWTWYEFTPYECGTFSNGGRWIDTRFFGTPCYNGTNTVSQPEYPLSTWMGSWGSAFSLTRDELGKAIGVSIDSLIDKAKDAADDATKTYIPFLGKLATGFALNHIWASNERIAPLTIPNYTYGLRNISPEQLNPDRYRDSIMLIDGGHMVLEDKEYGKSRHNFASVPALLRNVDVLIMCDTNRETGSLEHLFATASYARLANLNFPDIEEEDVRDINQNVAHVLKSKSSQAPVVVYIQGKNHSSYYKKTGKSFDPGAASFTLTPNFAYTSDEVDQFTGLTSFLIGESRPQIKEAIEDAIKKKKVRQQAETIKQGAEERGVRQEKQPVSKTAAAEGQTTISDAVAKALSQTGGERTVSIGLPSAKSRETKSAQERADAKRVIMQKLREVVQLISDL